MAMYHLQKKVNTCAAIEGRCTLVFLVFKSPKWCRLHLLHEFLTSLVNSWIRISPRELVHLWLHFWITTLHLPLRAVGCEFWTRGSWQIMAYDLQPHKMNQRIPKDFLILIGKYQKQGQTQQSTPAQQTLVRLSWYCFLWRLAITYSK